MRLKGDTRSLDLDYSSYKLLPPLEPINPESPASILRDCDSQDSACFHKPGLLLLSRPQNPTKVGFRVWVVIRALRTKPKRLQVFISEAPRNLNSATIIAVCTW